MGETNKWQNAGFGARRDRRASSQAGRVLDVSNMASNAIQRRGILINLKKHFGLNPHYV